MADSTATANKLTLFWDKAENEEQLEIMVYNSVSRSKLLYGLECLELTQAEQDKLDAFQIKGLRRILHTPPTHIDRSNTNDKVVEKASIAMGKPTIRLSETWRSQKFKLLGHLLRAERTDPLHQVCFQGDDKTPRAVAHRRRGRPREQWLLNTLEDAYDETTPQNIECVDPANEYHIEWLVQAAISRDGK